MLWMGWNLHRVCLPCSRGRQQHLRLHRSQRCTFRTQRWDLRSSCLQDRPDSRHLTLMLAATYLESMEHTASRGCCPCLRCPGGTQCMSFGQLQLPSPPAGQHMFLFGTCRTPLPNHHQGQQSQARRQCTRWRRHLRICHLGTELRRTAWRSWSRSLDAQHRIQRIRWAAQTTQQDKQCSQPAMPQQLLRICQVDN